MNFRYFKKIIYRHLYFCHAAYHSLKIRGRVTAKLRVITFSKNGGNT